jgi:hypothetical protein
MNIFLHRSTSKILLLSQIEVFSGAKAYLTAIVEQFSIS